MFRLLFLCRHENCKFNTAELNAGKKRIDCSEFAHKRGSGMKYLCIRYRFYALFLSMCLGVTASFALDSKTVAVFDFSNNSIFNREMYEPLSRGLSHMFISELGLVESLVIVERQELNLILDEMKLQQSGLTGETLTARAGALSGAHYMVFGSFMVDTKEKMRIDIRVVHVETGRTIKAAEITGKSKQFMELIKKLSEKIVTSLPVALSDNEKKSLRQYEKIRFDALVHFSKGLASEDAGDYPRAKKHFSRALREQPDFSHVKKHVLSHRERYMNSK